MMNHRMIELSIQVPNKKHKTQHLLHECTNAYLTSKSLVITPIIFFSMLGRSQLGLQ